MRAARYLPNLITILRLASVPAAVWLIVAGHLTAAFWVFAAAGASDAVDGILARLLHAHSALGSYLDALADKVLLVSTFVALGFRGLVWGWLVLLVVCRDLLLVGFAVFMHSRGLQTRVEPLLISKVNTVAQILLAAVVMGQAGVMPVPPWLVAPLSWVVAATTTVSAAAYLASWRRRESAAEAEGTRPSSERGGGRRRA